ncbi:MAG: hypothetical protein WBC45_01275 [Atribacterota bacterium]
MKTKKISVERIVRKEEARSQEPEFRRKNEETERSFRGVQRPVNLDFVSSIV